MDSVEQFILSGRIVDIALAVLVIEILWLSWRYRQTGRGLPPSLLFTNAGAGGSLMLALKAVLTGAAWPWIAAALLASLVFHVADLRHRWVHAPDSSSSTKDPNDP
ncbi:MAG: hypothetical protein V2I57_07575 [Xanthomonadales bacterium]|nr:hypothetical protein [Xanthomonadales bacterium]